MSYTNVLDSTWRVEIHPSGTFIGSDESPLIATVHDQWHAQKISAVPEMYAALKSLEDAARNCVKQFGGDHHHDPAYLQAKSIVDALDKAELRQ